VSEDIRWIGAGGADRLGENHPHAQDHHQTGSKDKELSSHFDSFIIKRHYNAVEPPGQRDGRGYRDREHAHKIAR